eukprot:3880568-Rhodomonas_salina.1
MCCECRSSCSLSSASCGQRSKWTSSQTQRSKLTIHRRSQRSRRIHTQRQSGSTVTWKGAQPTPDRRNGTAPPQHFDNARSRDTDHVRGGVPLTEGWRILPASPPPCATARATRRQPVRCRGT